MSSNNSPRKTLIIGSGIGGLSTGIILAGLGYEVTIVEKNSRPGGLIRSYTRDGIECEVGVHYLGSLDQGQILHKFFNYLGVSEDIPVTRMGENGIIDRYLFNRGTKNEYHFDLPSGLDEYEHNLRQVFSREQENISVIMASIRRAAGQLHGLDLLYGTENDLSLLDQSQPLGELLDKLGVSPGLRSVLAISSSWIGVPLADCPAYYHNMALASYVSSSYRLKRSGSHMAGVFTRKFEALGGKILTSSAVHKIDVREKQVNGVLLLNGEFISAPLIIATVHPKILLTMLPEKGAVRPSYRQRITGISDTHSIFSVHVRLDADKHPNIPYNIFKIDTDAVGNVPDLRYYQIRDSTKKDASLLSILTSGSDGLWAPWKKTTTGRRGRNYLQAKEQHAIRLIREAKDIFGPFSGLKILDSYTPLTIRDWVGSPNGSAYGVQRSASQILATALLNRTSVKGLYLAGQNVMAPGVIGTIMGSFSTVKLILGAKAFKKNVQL